MKNINLATRNGMKDKNRVAYKAKISDFSTNVLFLKSFAATKLPIITWSKKAANAKGNT